MIKARINVTLKNGVLDPQGEAIRNSLGVLGFSHVASIRQGKVFDIEMNHATCTTEVKAELHNMCEKLLVNHIIEDYTVELR